MTKYVAQVMHAATGGMGTYEFDSDDDLLLQTPFRVIRKFMQHVGSDLIPASYKDYELNAAFKNEQVQVVTGMGELVLQKDPPIPFLIMIGARDRKADAA